MIIKKVGTLLFIKLGLFKIIAKLAPLAMFASFFLFYFTLDLKESYLFEEPSLFTKLTDIVVYKSALPLNYNTIRPGIKYIKIVGAIENECILMTFPSQNEQSTEIKNIYETFTKGSFNAKSIVLLSYQNVSQLNSFFNWYYDPDQNFKISFGIIRLGLNIEINQLNLNSTLSKEDSKEIKRQAYFDIYSPSLHPDLDYFGAIKELLEVTNHNWLPCPAVQQKPLKSIKQTIIKIGKFLNVKEQLQVYINHFLCQFQHHLNSDLTPQQIMMENGFQASSISFMILNSSINNQSSEKVAVSFVKELSLQEDHLHSARVFFYPLSRLYQLPILSFMLPSIVMAVASVIYLLNRLIHSSNLDELSIPFKPIAISFVWIWQYHLIQQNQITLVIALALLGVSICQQFKAIQSKKNENVKYTYVQLLISSVLIAIGCYFGLLCFSLSIITMLAIAITVAKPSSPRLCPVFKLTILLILLFFFVSTENPKNLTFPQIFLQPLSNFSALSNQFRTILIVLCMHLSI